MYAVAPLLSGWLCVVFFSFCAVHTQNGCELATNGKTAASLLDIWPPRSAVHAVRCPLTSDPLCGLRQRDRMFRRPLARAVALVSSGGALLSMTAQQRIRADDGESHQVYTMKTDEDGKMVRHYSSALRTTPDPGSERLIQPAPRKRICVFG